MPAGKKQNSTDAIVDLANCNKVSCSKQVQRFVQHSFKALPEMARAIQGRDGNKLLKSCQKGIASKEKNELTKCSLSKCAKQYRRYAVYEAKDLKRRPKKLQPIT
jgi:hypothetical protein